MTMAERYRAGVTVRWFMTGRRGAYQFHIQLGFAAGLVILFCTLFGYKGFV